MTPNPKPIPNQSKEPITNPDLSTKDIKDQPSTVPSVVSTAKPKPQQSSQNLSLLISVMLLLLLVGQILGFYQLTGEVIKRQAAGIKLLQQQSSSNQITQLQSKYKDKFVIIDQAFPPEDQIPQIVNMINNRLSTFPESQLRFDNNAPITNANDKFPYLSVTITLTAAKVEDISKLLDDMTAGGIVFAAQDVDLAIRAEPEAQVKAIIKAKLYVQATQK